jgi:uncharacterized membrane protein
LLLLSFCFWLDIMRAKKNVCQSTATNISSHGENKPINETDFNRFDILILLKYTVIICLAIIGCIVIIVTIQPFGACPF